MELLIVLIIIFAAASSRKKGGKQAGGTAKLFRTFKKEFFTPPPDPPMPKPLDDEAPQVFMEGEGAARGMDIEGVHGGEEGECTSGAHAPLIAVSHAEASAPVSAAPRVSAQDLRRAVVMMEILSPPKALRGRR